MPERKEYSPPDDSRQSELASVARIPERFLRPEPTGLALPLPMGGKSLYDILDSNEIGLEPKGAVVRNRYPYTAAIVDRQFADTKTAHEANPQDQGTLHAFRKAIGLSGAFNYIRGMEVVMKDGQIDRDVAPKMMLSPSAAIQLHEVADIAETDRVLDLYAGAGYATFFLGTAGPARLDAVDLYTPKHYDLEETHKRAYRDLYADIPDSLKPPVTKPTFIEADSTQLPHFGSEKATELGLTSHYDKMFLHPPYGRESTLLIPSVSEGDAFIMWVNSAISAVKANAGEATIYSVVPEEWNQTLEAIKHGAPVDQAMQGLYSKLAELRYYGFPENASKLQEPYDLTQTENWTQDEISVVFGNTSVQPLQETGMFGLDIHTIRVSST
jgi:hypothetical protein